MNKFKAATLGVIIFCIIFSVSFSFKTKQSFRIMDLNTATVGKKDDDPYIINEKISDGEFNYKNISESVKSRDNIFVVKVVSQKYEYMETITEAYVEKVIKGDKDAEGKNIDVYELNHFHYVFDRKSYVYFMHNEVENIMHIGDKYLIFCNNTNYIDSYKEKNGNKIYDMIADDILPLSYFPIDKEITRVGVEKIKTYADIANYDWVCYTDEQANVFNEIRVKILEEYLGKDYTSELKTE